MCTALTYETKDFYFGRNMDYMYLYPESVTVTPRNFPLVYRNLPEQKHHYAMIGMAYVKDGYPLYYDATNEKGLSIAGLNFPNNAVYRPYDAERDNVAPFELMPWIMSQCANLSEAKTLLRRINLVAQDFSPELPATPMHWMISDRTGSITVEPVAEGLMVYDNSVGVLTNNPPFATQMFALNNYAQLSAEPCLNRFAPGLKLDNYSMGMGAIGLPGDLSSQSRFVRAVFCKLNATSGSSEEESISQFFHLLGAVEMQRGCVCLEKDCYEITIYSSCCNADRGIYYYTTYNNQQITAVSMHQENLDGCELVYYPLVKTQQIRYENTSAAQPTLASF